MVKLPYQKFNYILMNSLNLNYPNMVPDELVFSLGEYLKSQMHFPVMPYTDNRSLREYFLAYQYYKGIVKNESEQCFYKVVKYFYEDVAKALDAANKSDKFNFFIDCDCNSSQCPVEKVDEEFIERMFNGDDSPIAQKKINLLKALSEDESNILISEVN